MTMTYEITQSPTLERLVTFEQVSWPKELQATPGELKQRLEAFPEGVFILSDDGEDIAQVTVSPKAVPSEDLIISFEEMRDLPVDRTSKTLWVTNIATKIEAVGKGYGTRLFGEVVGYGVRAGFELIMAGVSCYGFKEALQKSDVCSIDEYMEKGLNPAVRVFQQSAQAHGCGFLSGAPIANYWSDDEESIGYGVLVTIDLRKTS